MGEAGTRLTPPETPGSRMGPPCAYARTGLARRKMRGGGWVTARLGVFPSRDIPQLAPAIQRDHHKVEDATTEPVPDAVFALAGRAWPVRDRHLLDDGSPALSQN